MAFNLRFSKEELKRIGSRMHAARVLTGMKREDFALKQNISPMSIKNWELGRVLPRHEGIVSVINAFKDCGIFASPEWLLYGSGASPNYLETATFEQEETTSEFLDEQIKLFKKAQRSKGFNPVVVFIKSNHMEPIYKVGDVLGGIIVSQEFARCELAKNAARKSPWLITGANGLFVPALLFLQGETWLMNTCADAELIECPSPSIAKIKWHYAVGEEI